MQSAKTVVLSCVLVVFCSQNAYSESARELYASAANHYSSAKWKSASAQFQQFLAKHPQDQRFADAQFFLAESLMQNRQFKESCAAFQKFFVHNSNHRFSKRGLFRWGEAAMFAGLHSDAIRLLTQFYETNPDHELNAYALVYLARSAISGSISAETVTVRARSTRLILE